MKIKIFVTGGTFDKEYDQIHEKLIFNKTHVPEMLKWGKSKLNTDVETLMMVDSLYMTDKEKQIILEGCKKTPEKKIVITHGTGTMSETAKLLGKKIKDKTIILTGAMVPYTIKDSDGLFNLGSALSFVQVLPPGVYIAMNGTYFKAGNVIKNTKIGEFEELT